MRVFKRALLGWFLLTGLLWGGERLLFGVNPYKEPEAMRILFEPLLNHLSQALGKEIVLVVAKDYTHLATLLREGKVDIASISPKLYATVRKTMPHASSYLATTQVADEEGRAVGQYHGVIVTLKRSGITSLAALKGKRFGFTDKESTSGYLYPHTLLREAGIEPSRDFATTFMLKKHPKVLHALLEGSIDAGAVYAGAYKQMAHTHPDTFYVLATTEAIPYDAVVAATHLAKEVQESLKRALLKYQGHTGLKGGDGIVGFEQIDPRVYDRYTME